jgi:hypothetical protein
MKILPFGQPRKLLILNNNSTSKKDLALKIEKLLLYRTDGLSKDKEKDNYKNRAVAKILRIDEKILVTLWIADKIIATVGEEVASKAFKIAQQTVNQILNFR